MKGEIVTVPVKSERGRCCCYYSNGCALKAGFNAFRAKISKLFVNRTPCSLRDTKAGKSEFSLQLRQGDTGKPCPSFSERVEHQGPSPGGCLWNRTWVSKPRKPPSVKQEILPFRWVSSCAFNSRFCMKRSHPAVKTAKPSHFILRYELVNMKYIQMQKAFCCLLAEADQYLLSQRVLLQLAADKLLGLGFLG